MTYEQFLKIKIRDKLYQNVVSESWEKYKVLQIRKLITGREILIKSITNKYNPLKKITIFNCEQWEKI